MTTAELPTTKGQQTRQRILAAAAPLFNQKGFAGASMQEILDATGLEKGGLYRHFPTKQHLAEEALRYTMARSVRTRTEPLDPTQTAPDQLRTLIARFVTAPSTIPGGCPLMNTAIDADDTNPNLRALARHAVEDWKTRLIQIIDRGIAAGHIRPETQPRQIANTIIATLEGALMLSRLEAATTPLEDARDTLDHVLRAITPKSQRHPQRRRTSHQ
jgi:TetR/AcrR family transcriptional repressor of nem operon